MIFKGMDHVEVSRELAIPSIAELLQLPSLNKVDADELYKKGNDFHRYLIDNTPISGKFKHVAIHYRIQFLNPHVRPILTKYKGRYDNEWHADNVDGGALYHILSNDCFGRTAFSKDSVEFEEGSKDFVEFLNEDCDLEEMKMTPNAISTFDEKVIHRGVQSPYPEFRFFYRVMETNKDSLAGRSFEDSITSGEVYELNRNNNLESVKRTKDAIKIYMNGADLR